MQTELQLIGFLQHILLRMKLCKIALLIDSVEAYAGIDKVIALKKKYPGKIIAPRLDS